MVWYSMSVMFLLEDLHSLQGVHVALLNDLEGRGLVWTKAVLGEVMFD